MGLCPGTRKGVGFMKNKNTTRFKLLALTACIMVVFLLATGCGSEKEDVLAKVNGENITRLQMDDVVKMVQLYTPDIDAMMEEEGFKEYLEETFLQMLVDNTLIKQEIKRLNLELDEADLEEAYMTVRSQLVAERYDSEAELDQRMKDLKLTEESVKELLSGEVAANTLFEYLLKDLTDEDVRIFAQENELLLEKASLKVHHILLETEEEALEALKRVRQGEDFNEVAAELSTDPSAATNQGLLGTVYEGQPGWDTDFLAGAFALEAGEISEPVESQYGWHVIFVEEKYASYTKDFEEEKEELRSYKEQEIISEYLEDLWENSEIQFAPFE
jgi:foldase protein PrsA